MTARTDGVRSGRAAIAVAVWAALLAGCSAATPAPAKWTRADIVGNWSATRGGSIRILANGTFQENGVPPGVLSGSSQAAAVTSGTWQLQQDAVGTYVNFFPGGEVGGDHGTLTLDGTPKHFSLCYLSDDLTKSTDTCDLEYVTGR